MKFPDNNTRSKLFYVSNQYFPSHTIQKNIIKINNEPYSYWIDKTKMYVFCENELFDFLVWYWNFCKESFLVDFCNINYSIPWKYFCNKITDFKTNYPNVDTYNSNIIEKDNLVEIYNDLINVVGLDNFINSIVIHKYKLMSIKKTNNVLYKFATDCGKQIFNQ
jgi:hypothetical protein